MPESTPRSHAAEMRQRRNHLRGVNPALCLKRKVELRKIIATKHAFPITKVEAPNMFDLPAKPVGPATSQPPRTLPSCILQPFNASQQTTSTTSGSQIAFSIREECMTKGESRQSPSLDEKQQEVQDKLEDMITHLEEFKIDQATTAAAQEDGGRVAFGFEQVSLTVR